MRAPSPKQRRKASEYMWQRRVRIIDAGPDYCTATVRGTSTYNVTLANGRWDCDCELRNYRPSWACTHIAATWLWWNCQYGEQVAVNST